MLTFDDELLTYQEVALILKVSPPKTIMNWKCDGKFKAGRDYIKIGKSRRSAVRFKKSAIMSKIKNNSL